VTWTEHVIDWTRGGGIHCDLCGRLLPRRAWTVEVDGESRRFCDPECEELDRELRPK
jgi:hypothetical protein